MGKISMSITISICGNSLMFVSCVNLLCFYIVYQFETQSLGCVRLWIVTEVWGGRCEGVKLNWATLSPKPLTFFAQTDRTTDATAEQDKQDSAGAITVILVMNRVTDYTMWDVQKYWRSRCLQETKVEMSISMKNYFLFLKKKKSHSFCCVFC